MSVAVETCLLISVFPRRTAQWGEFLVICMWLLIREGTTTSGGVHGTALWDEGTHLPSTHQPPQTRVRGVKVFVPLTHQQPRATDSPVLETLRGHCCCQCSPPPTQHPRGSVHPTPHCCLPHHLLCRPRKAAGVPSPSTESCKVRKCYALDVFSLCLMCPCWGG